MSKVRSSPWMVYDGKTGWRDRDRQMNACGVSVWYLCEHELSLWWGEGRDELDRDAEVRLHWEPRDRPTSQTVTYCCDTLYSSKEEFYWSKFEFPRRSVGVQGPTFEALAGLGRRSHEEAHGILTVEVRLP